MGKENRKALPDELQARVLRWIDETPDPRRRVRELMRQHPEHADALERMLLDCLVDDDSTAAPTAEPSPPLSSASGRRPGLGRLKPELPLTVELRLVDAVAGAGKIRRLAVNQIVEDHPTLRHAVRAWIERFSLRSTSASSHFRMIQHYLLFRELGRGAMGIVYLAWDNHLDRWVALKILRGGWLDDAGIKTRFAREAKALARLQHPAIVPLFEVGEFEGSPFFTTELVRGLSLDRIVDGLDRAGEPPAELTAKNLADAFAAAGVAEPIRWEGSYEDAVCRIGVQAASALEASHRAGILHRDVKSSNIMLTTSGQVRVFDFGLARVTSEQTLTRSGDMLGTPVYLAPELLLGTGRVGEGADAYALGVTLYELLTLRAPYDSDTMESLYRSVRDNEPNRLRRYNASVGRDLEAIIHKAIEKDPTDRYADVESLRTHLECYLRREPVEIRRTGPIQRAYRSAKRHSGRIAAAAILAAVVALPVLYLLWERTKLTAASIIANLEQPQVIREEDLHEYATRALTFAAADRVTIQALVGEHEASRKIVAEAENAPARMTLLQLDALRRKVAGCRSGYREVAERALQRRREGLEAVSNVELQEMVAALQQRNHAFAAEADALRGEVSDARRRLEEATSSEAATRRLLEQADQRLLASELWAAELEVVLAPAWDEDAFTLLRQLTSRFRMSADGRGAFGPADLETALHPGRALPGYFAVRADGRRKLAAKSRDPARAIELGLEWLAQHQDPDGRWDADGFMKHDAKDARCNGPGDAGHDVGITGLALLAFLGDGSTMSRGPYRAQVSSGVRWLCDQQHDNGRFGTDRIHAYIYDHAIATHAIVEAYGSGSTLLRRYAQRGIDYLEEHRNPDMVWRYEPQGNDNDTSITGWCVMAYTTAEEFGLEVNEQTRGYCAVWFDQVTDPASGRAGYRKRGESSDREEGDHEVNFPRDKGEALTAVGLMCRFWLRQTPDRQPVMVAAADTLLKTPPVWNEDDGSIDHFYWYYATYALHQMGKYKGKDYWGKWSKALTKAVVKTQRADKSFEGSWDPVGVWGEFGGRVYSTALLTMTLQAPYRYPRKWH
ncbi:MAG: protein kinase [Planctomycetota bacterium]